MSLVTYLNLIGQTWSLIDIDNPGIVITGDFPAENQVQDLGANWVEEYTAGRRKPILQFSNEIHGPIRFLLRAIKWHVFDDIQTLATQIKGTVETDTILGRPHVYTLTIGSEFSEQVVVSSVGGIAYEKPDYTGAIRGIVFPITVLPYEEFSFESVPLSESEVVWSREGDTFEYIAYRKYANPMYGELLRQRNSGLVPLKPEVRFKAPPKAILEGELPVKPASIALSDSDEAIAQRRAILTARGGEKIKHKLRA